MKLFSWEITVPPTSLPIEWADLQNHLRLTDSTQEDYVTICMEDAVDYFQSQTESSLATQTITATYHEMPSDGKLFLPRGPVQYVEAIFVNGTPVPTTQYDLRRAGNNDYVNVHGRLGTPITVVYVAGYTDEYDGNEVPHDIRRALFYLTSNFFENREPQSPKSLVEVSNGLQRIIDRYKRTPMGG